MINTEYKHLVYLAACAVHDQIPDRTYIDQMNLCLVYRLAKYHTMTAVSYMALESSGVLSDTKWLREQSEEMQSVLRKWKEAKEKAVRKNFLLDAECAKLFAFCKKEQIWYMPLKGSVLKDMYPKAGMRQMADVDILFDASAQKKIKKYFVGQGYQVTLYAKYNHDTYEKKPVYNFEMHTALFGKMHPKEMQEYYRNVKDRLIANNEKGYGYHFSTEDFYVYMLAHSYKHYKRNGTGLRTLMDIYVYRSQYANTWNRTYVEQELKKLSLFEYEQMAGALAERLFGRPERIFAEKFGDADMKQIGYYVVSGTYGTTQNKVENKLKELQKNGKPVSRWTKLRYLLRRLFPSVTWFREHVVICDRFPVIIPFYCVFRLISKSLTSFRKAYAEIKAVIKARK